MNNRDAEIPISAPILMKDALAVLCFIDFIELIINRPRNTP
jgi:hypothetical protein